MKELIEELKEKGKITINQNKLPEFIIELGKENKPLMCKLDYGIENMVMIFVDKKEDQKPFEDYRDFILEEYKKGNVVVLGPDNIIQSAPLEGVVKQHVDGLLYDLNRDEATVLTFIDDPKWVNDYAVAKVIRELKRQLEEKK